MAKNERNLIIHPFRLIPFDLGHEINGHLFDKIQEYLKKSGSWDIIKNELRDDGEIIVGEYKKNLFIHIYKDGIGIFTLEDSEERYDNWESYNPDYTMELRKESHKNILTHNHSMSTFIDDTLKGLRSLFNNKKMRFSASPDWENKGLSYVMSFYFIECEPNIVQKEDFQRKLVSLLFPYYDERKDVDYYDKIKDKNGNNSINDELIKIAKHNFEMLPYLHTCASWSNFLIIGKIDKKIIDEYWYLERELQHIWYYTYITDKFIERSLKNINTSTPEKALSDLDNILTDMIFKINKYEGIISSTMHERDFKLYEGLRRTSRLDLLVKNVEKKSNILKNRYNWLLNEKRTKADKRIQFILFLIAVISIFGAYETFLKIGIWSGIIIIILSVLGGLFLFKPFFNTNHRFKR